jgi:hypothetical protein
MAFNWIIFALVRKSAANAYGLFDERHRHSSIVLTKLMERNFLEFSFPELNLWLLWRLLSLEVIKDKCKKTERVFCGMLEDC